MQKEKHVATYRGLRGLWRPPAETLEAIAAVLGEHWRAAATSRTARIFWATPVSWLRAGSAMTRTAMTRTGMTRTAVTPVPVPLTTAPTAADSSGTPPGPHPS